MSREDVLLRQIQMGIDASRTLFFRLRSEMDLTTASPELREAWSEMEAWLLRSKRIASGMTPEEAENLDGCMRERFDGSSGVIALMGNSLDDLRPVLRIIDGQRDETGRKP